MERCPNCGEMVRSGARYCTTCGYRMPELRSEAPGEIMSDDAQPSAPQASGWPEFSPSQPDPETALSANSSSPDDDSTATANGTVSDQAPASFWPAPPIAPNERDDNPEGAVESAIIVADLAEAPVDEAGEPGASQARERILALLDEVREFVSAIPNDDRDDLRGVVAELEVASTPPGAFDPEDLASLRDALLVARDRPRDLDTVLDLTGRIDNMVALVFAYERAHAAIERALAVLRRE